MAAEDAAVARRTTSGRRAALPAWVARGVLVALAVVAAAVGLRAIHSQHECDAAINRRTANPAQAIAAVNHLVDVCPLTRETLARVVALGILSRPEAFLATAGRIARETPGNYLGWLVLDLAAQRSGDRRLQREAEARIVDLVPGFELP